MLRVTFVSEAARDAFASRFNLDTKVGNEQLDIGWHLLQFAKLDPSAVDYDDHVMLTTGASTNAQEFIVKGDPAKFDGKYGDVKEDLGGGFYLVLSLDGTVLGDHVESIEHIGNSITLMEANTSDLNTFNGTDTTLDPTSSDGQWPRIRVASRYRPLLPSYNTHNATYQSKPELFVIDSGINFNHPEFDYPQLDKVDFYKVPRFSTYADQKGHGTAVASMACGKNLGIAANVKLMNVKIGDDTTTASLFEIGKAIDAILAHIASNPAVTRVINISWTVARSAWLDSKIEALQTAGATIVCAAGNNGVSVEDLTPAGINSVITVGAIDQYDIPAGFNNISPDDSGTTTGIGLSLDLFAPGVHCVVANYEGGYKAVSGTSFSAPIVAGIASEISALFSTPILYVELKEKVLSTATKNALLFEDERFSENQNNLAYIFTADQASIYKTQNLSSYIGVHDEEPLVVNLNSMIDTSILNKIFTDDPIRWSISFEDPSLESTYSKFITCEESGIVTIAKPDVTLGSDVKLQAVSFKGIAQNSKVSAISNTIFFFVTNPLFLETSSADITQALAEMNAVTYSGTWFFIK